MWCLVVFQHDLNDQCVPHGKEKLLLQDPQCQKGKLFMSASHGITGNKYYDANELQLPLLLYPVKALSQMTTT